MESSLLIASPWPWYLIVSSGLFAAWLTWQGYRLRHAELQGERLRLLQLVRLTVWVLLFICLLQPMQRQTVAESRNNRVTVLIDDSESMGFIDRADGVTRLTRVIEALNGKSGKGLLRELEQGFQVGLEGFAGGAQPIGAISQLQALGERTDLTKSLEESLGRLNGADAAGLILIGDGSDTVRGDVLRVARTYRRAGIPIYCVGVGATDVPDLSVTQVRCRRTVSKDTLVRVEVDVRRDGIPEGSFPVRIIMGDEIVKESMVELKTDTATAIFEFLPRTQGFQEYEAVIEPIAGEPIVSNNSLAFGLVANSRKLRVLYMEGSQLQHHEYGRPYWPYKWEHEFLKDALEEDGDVEVDVLFKTMPPQFEGRMKTVREGFPIRKKDLYRYDVVINSDIPIAHFSDDQIQWTVDFVGKHGGGFIMIGGWDAFGEGGYAKSKIDRMLPVEMDQDDRHADGTEFFWAVTPEGYKHPIMQIDSDPEKNRKIWEMLNTIGGTTQFPRPAFSGYSKTLRSKPAATTLAVIDDELLHGAYGPMVLVAVQPFGRGRSMAFTTDCTGGWGAVWEDSWGDDPRDPERRNIYYKAFWKNAIRWLAHNRLNAPNQLVQITTERLVYGRGETPIAEVQVLTEDYEPTHEAQLTLKITAPDGSTERLQVFPQYESAGRYERKLELNQKGRYLLEVGASLRGELLGSDSCIIQVRASTEELRYLSQNVTLLQKIAEESGGAYFKLEEAERIPQYLREDTHIVRRYRDTDLWDNGYLFVLIIGLLSCEWYFRKKYGLP